jgi:RNA polymerase sigma-70 factor (ECF subfamily)
VESTLAAATTHRTADDSDAFSRLYETYVDQVYRYLLSRTGRPVDAEELTSRTFLNALAHLEGYRGGGTKFGSWLMSIAHNLLANWYRDRGRRPSTAPLDDALEIPGSTPGPESTLELNERIQRVRAAVRALSSDRQQLLALKYVEGCTNAEIGRRMGRTEGAVKALHHRTLLQLQQALGEP